MSGYISSNSHFFTWLRNTCKTNIGSISSNFRHSSLFGMILEIRKRRELRKLLEAAPEHLKDLGINRKILKDALALPLDQSSGKWLEFQRHQDSNKDLNLS